MPRERGQKLVASNRKARHDYHILDVYEAGIVLTGTEVKSLRAGRASLIDGYATIDGGEAWLENVHIPEFLAGSWTNHATRRRRKLLLNRAELNKLGGKVKESGLTIVPLSLYFHRASHSSRARPHLTCAFIILHICCVWEDCRQYVSGKVMPNS